MAEALHLLLPPWAVAAVFALVLAAAVPAWLNNVRIKQIRGLVRRMVRASADEREAMIERALSLADRKPTRLITAVEQAAKYDQRGLQERAMATLDEVAPDEAARLRFKMQPDALKKVQHPLEVAVRVERLLAEGLVDAAAEHLDGALARSPDDPDLRALTEVVGAARAGERADASAEG